LLSLLQLLKFSLLSPKKLAGDEKKGEVGTAPTRWSAGEPPRRSFFLIFFWYFDSSSSSHHRSTTIFLKNWYIKPRSEKEDSKKTCKRKKKGRYKRYLLVLKRRTNDGKASIYCVWMFFLLLSLFTIWNSSPITVQFCSYVPKWVQIRGPCCCEIQILCVCCLQIRVLCVCYLQIRVHVFMICSYDFSEFLHFDPEFWREKKGICL